MTADTAPRVQPQGNEPLARGMAVLLFAIVVIVWGLNWPVTKIIVESIHLRDLLQTEISQCQP